jgi:hypothetical protein
MSRSTGGYRARLTIGLLGMGVVPIAPAGTAPHEPNILTHAGPASTPATLAIEQLALSDRLADFGEQRKDPVALVEAAMIRKQTTTVLRHTEVSDEPRTWESLLARARQIAGSNPTITGLIAQVRAYKVRNIPTVPGDASVLNKNVKQRGADRVEVRFSAGQPAVVYVRPVPEVNLDLSVYDEYNNLICTGAGESRDVQCRWRPRWDGLYLVDVRNNNDTEVAYVLAINREIGAP